MAEVSQWGASARRWRNVASAWSPLEPTFSLRWACTFGAALLGGAAQLPPLARLVKV